MITTVIENILKKVLIKLNFNSDTVTIIKSKRNDCDYQFDGCFKLSKELNKNPYEIGELIVEKLKSEPEIDTYFSAITCVKPGFINFILQDSFINETLNLMASKPKFNILMPQPETIIIDYGGPNVAKPLHIGHLRSAIVGESIKRILKYMNQFVIADVHLGDYGLQIGQVIYGLKKENIKPQAINLETLERIYPSISALCKTNNDIKTECEIITKELQDGDLEYQNYYKKILEISKADIKRIYDYLDVHFDLWYGESDAYKYIDPLKKELKKENLLIMSDGASVIDVKQEDDKIEVPPLIFQKSNGGSLYGTTDLATIYERIKDYKPNKILYVTDLRQHLHFTQVFRVCAKYSLTQNTKFEHLGFGTVNGLDGKPYKTRSGDVPKLDSLFNETSNIFLTKKEENKNLSKTDLDIITNSIIKFADLQNNREKDYIFDMNKFSDITGKTGPYILYTYLRINKIVKEYNQPVDKLGKTIYNNQDRQLRVKLLELNNIINLAYETRHPSTIANFLYELCVVTNTFYENNHINNLEDLKKQNDWVNILKLTKDIIMTLLDLLVIKIPSVM